MRTTPFLFNLQNNRISFTNSPIINIWMITIVKIFMRRKNKFFFMFGCKYVMVAVVHQFQNKSIKSMKGTPSRETCIPLWDICSSGRRIWNNSISQIPDGRTEWQSLVSHQSIRWNDKTETRNRDELFYKIKLMVVTTWYQLIIL